MVIWLIGMSGSGKTTVGRQVYETLKPKRPQLVFLDGDILRDVWQDQLGHDVASRRKNSDRICALCQMLDRQGIDVICCVLSIFPEARQWNRQHYSAYYEAYLKVSLEELQRRDTKGLYGKALAGELENVVGVDISFPEPTDSDRVICNEADQSVDQSVALILEDLAGRL